MNGQTLAHVRRVLSGPDRTLIHAVTGAGHDLKLEVPAETVRELDPGRGFVLMVSWSLLELPPVPAEVAAVPTSAPPDESRVATPSTAAVVTPNTTTSPANAVDAAFMALMARSRRDTPSPGMAAPPATAAPPASTAASDADPERQIAALLGLAPKP